MKPTTVKEEMLIMCDIIGRISISIYRVRMKRLTKMSFINSLVVAGAISGVSFGICELFECSEVIRY